MRPMYLHYECFRICFCFCNFCFCFLLVVFFLVSVFFWLYCFLFLFYFWLYFSCFCFVLVAFFLVPVSGSFWLYFFFFFLLCRLKFRFSPPRLLAQSAFGIAVPFLLVAFCVFARIELSLAHPMIPSIFWFARPEQTWTCVKPFLAVFFIDAIARGHMALVG